MSEPSSLERNATARVNRHGYAFQQAVLKTMEIATKEGISSFLFHAEEFPVAMGANPTRIDFVLRHQSKSIYLIGECKRVNPAYAAWLLAKTPYVRRNYDPGELSFDRVYWTPHLETGRPWSGRALLNGYGDRLSNLAIPFKAGEKGDSCGGSDDDAIELAATQVFRGVNGFMELLARRKELCAGDPAAAIVVPAIVTTAKLYTTNAKLEDAELLTGEIGTLVDLREIGWSWFRYHVSPALRSKTLVTPDDRVVAATGVDLARLLDLEYARSVAIVNAASIGDFMRDLSVAAENL